MELAAKAVLVTGANGFVGSRLVRRLVAEGARVRALVRNPSARAELEALGAEPFLGQLTQEDVPRAAMEGIQAVVHCAATGLPDRTESFLVNSTSTQRLLDAALAAKCERFVHLSTTSVYALEGREEIDEDTPTTSRDSVYSESKAEADGRVLQAQAQGLACTILRPALILGSHPSSVWGNKVPRAIAAGRFPLAGDGLGEFAYVHVDSLVEAIVTALRSDAAVGQVINIVDGQSNWRRYTDHFRKTELPSIPAAQAPARLTSRARYSNAKAVKLLGHQPKHTFDEAMEETQRYLQSAP